MTYKSKLIFLILISLIFIAFLSSCGYLLGYSPLWPHSRINIVVPKDFEIQLPERHRIIPLRVGLYLSTKFKNYTLLDFSGDVNINPRPGDIFIGEALSSGCERMLKNLFTEIIIIDPLEANFSNKNIDIIIIPEVVKIITVVKKNWTTAPSSFWVQTIIKWNTFSCNGDYIYVNTIKAEGIQTFEYPYYYEARQEDLTKGYILAIQDQLRKAQEDLYSNKWWETVK